MLSAAATTTASGAQDLNTIYTLAVVLTAILGTGVIGAAIALFRWLQKRGVRENSIDALLHPKTGVNARFDQFDDQLAEFSRLITPNGLKTNELGNIVARTEKAVEALKGKVDDQSKNVAVLTERCDLEHKSLRRELDRKADR